MKTSFCIFLIFLATTARAETLRWDAPTHREAQPGQTPIALQPGELKEYRLYDQRKFAKAIPAPTVSVSVVILPGSVHIWEVTAVDTRGVQSDYSNAVHWYPTPVATIAWPPVEPANLNINK